MQSAVTLLLLVSCCGMALGQWDDYDDWDWPTGYPSYPPKQSYPPYPPYDPCKNVNCIQVVCPYGEYTPPGKCCPVCIDWGWPWGPYGSSGSDDYDDDDDDDDYWPYNWGK